MNHNKLAVIGVGNMAKAIINGILGSDMSISEFILYDINRSQLASVQSINQDKIFLVDSISDAVRLADCVLISVKPQNYPEVLKEISTVDGYKNKLYISIGAGISTKSVSDSLGGDIFVVRVLPNVPMLIGMGVSVICRNSEIAPEDFDFVKRVFSSAGSIIEIEESEMNRMIGVTSSAPAYVFKFIDAIYNGAIDQGISEEGLLDAICDMVIGSATMLKNGNDSPSELVSKVASKGGTTEKALQTLDKYSFSNAIKDAMKACTARADELGASK